MSATFLTGDSNAFLNALGLPYGLIVVEGVEPVRVVDLETTHSILATLSGDKMVSEEEADRVKVMAMAAGLAEDSAGVWKAAERHGFSPDHQPTTVRFVLCADPDCVGGLPHGELCLVGNRGSRDILTIEVGFVFLLQTVEAKESNSLDSAVAFQAMLRAGLPTDQHDLERRYQDLPEEVRRRLEEQSMPTATNGCR